MFSPGAVELEPNVHLEPDILVVPTGEPASGIKPSTRWTTIRRWWLAVEVSGEGSTPYDRDYKAPAYLALGVREVWRVDLRDLCVFVSSQQGSVRRHAGRVVWQPPELREPLTIQVPDLFLP